MRILQTAHHPFGAFGIRTRDQHPALGWVHLDLPLHGFGGGFHPFHKWVLRRGEIGAEENGSGNEKLQRELHEAN